MNLIKIFNLELKNLNRKEIILIYSIYISLTVIASLIFCNLYSEKFPYIVDENFNLILNKISFHHGK